MTEMHVTRSYIQAHRSWLFVYGDNLVRRGYGGQAKECRGEPNTLGIPTKHYPSMEKKAFFTDEDYWVVRDVIENAILSVDFSEYEKIIVLPRIGEGRAQLSSHSQKIWEYVQDCLKRLKEGRKKEENDGKT